MPWVAPIALTALFVFLFFPWIQFSKVTQTGWGTGFGEHMRVLGLFFILLFLPALFLTWTIVLFPFFSITKPPIVEKFWPWRLAIVWTLTLISFGFLFLQLVTEFGLEAKVLRGATKTAEELGVEFARLALYRTPWLWLAVISHIAAIVGNALQYWLNQRGLRPMPRIDIKW